MADVGDDPVLHEICEQLDTCAVVGWQAKFDLQQKRAFFKDLHTGIDTQSKHFVERSQQATTKSDAKLAELEAIRTKRRNLATQHAAAMAEAQQELEKVVKRNGVLNERCLKQGEQERDRRLATAAQEQVWGGKMLDATMALSRATQKHKEDSRSLRKIAPELERVKST